MNPRVCGPVGSGGSAGGVGAGVDGVSQAAPGGGGGPRAVQSSSLAAGEEEEKAPAEPTAQVSDADGHASEVTGERDASGCWGTWQGALVVAGGGGGGGGTPAYLHPSPPGRCTIVYFSLLFFFQAKGLEPHQVEQAFLAIHSHLHSLMGVAQHRSHCLV